MPRHVLINANNQVANIAEANPDPIQDKAYTDAMSLIFPTIVSVDNSVFVEIFWTWDAESQTFSPPPPPPPSFYRYDRNAETTVTWSSFMPVGLAGTTETATLDQLLYVLDQNWTPQNIEESGAQKVVDQAVANAISTSASFIILPIPIGDLLCEVLGVDSLPEIGQ